MPVNFVFGPYSYGEMPTEFGDWGMSGTITTGKFCSIGGALKFMVNGNHRMDGFTTYPVHLLGCRFIEAFKRPLPVIGNDVWIGANVTIYSGVTIGDGAIIAGNSVVAKSVPPYTVVAGNSAVVKKHRFTPEIVEKLLKYKWWDFPLEYITNRLVPLYEDINATVDEIEKIYFELHPEGLQRVTTNMNEPSVQEEGQ